MDISAQNPNNPGRADIGPKYEKANTRAVYIEIKEFPQKQKLNGSVEEEAGWLFGQK